MFIVSKDKKEMAKNLASLCIKSYKSGSFDLIGKVRSHRPLIIRLRVFSDKAFTHISIIKLSLAKADKG